MILKSNLQSWEMYLKTCVREITYQQRTIMSYAFTPEVLMNLLKSDLDVLLAPTPATVLRQKAIEKQKANANSTYNNCLRQCQVAADQGLTSIKLNIGLEPVVKEMLMKDGFNLVTTATETTIGW